MKTAGPTAACIAALTLVIVAQSAARFVESAAQAGLEFTHVNGATGRYYMPEIMGAGVALFDYDNDGDLDVFLVQGGWLDSETTLKGQGTTLKGPAATPASRLFRNGPAVTSMGPPRRRFADVEASSGFSIGPASYGMGTAVGDYDNDGDLDLFVTAFGPDQLYQNLGEGRFSNVTQTAGVSDPFWSTSAAFFDYDRDGDLDLFVANYLDFTVAGNKVCRDAVGALDYCTPRAYRPVPDRLYRNEGNGRFTDVSETAGITKADGAGLGVTVGDYNGDGWLDLYVANDGHANQLWLNQRNGTFVDDGLLSGAGLNAAGNPEGSMGIASGDFDADGDEDLFITNIVGETFALYVNDGKGSFEDARVRFGLARPTAAFTGFGTDWFDYDNDGWLDLFVANGAVNVVEAQRGEPFPFRMKNQLFRNTRGATFQEQPPPFDRAEVSRGAAFGDVDNDGDTDIVVTNNNGAVRLLRNETSTGNDWLEIRLKQASGNRFGMGARIGVERAGLPTLWRRVRTDGSYLSSGDPRVHFGLGALSPLSTVAVLVQWPDGQSERWTGIMTNRLVTLERGKGSSVP